MEAIKERDQCLEIAENKIQQQQHQLLEQQIQLHDLNASHKVSLLSIHNGNYTAFISHYYYSDFIVIISCWFLSCAKLCGPVWGIFY